MCVIKPIVQLKAGEGCRPTLEFYEILSYFN